MLLFPGRFSYALLLLLMLVDAVWISLSPVDLRIGDLANPLWTTAFLLLAVLALRRFRGSTERLAILFRSFEVFFQGMVFLQISWPAMRLFNHVSMTSAFPYADDLLGSWDRSLGLDWVAYFRFVESRPALSLLLDRSYTSLTVLSFGAFFVLVLCRRFDRARFFLEAFFVTAVICTTLGLFFPAKAAVAMHYGDAATLANLGGLPGVYHFEHLERLRNGARFALDLTSLPGLVTFPSFHTAAGVLLAICVWRTRLFPLVLAYSAIMIASTPVFGGHYFVDIVAGTTIAVMVAAFFASLPSYKGLFARRTVAPPRAIGSLNPVPGTRSAEGLA